MERLLFRLMALALILLILLSAACAEALPDGIDAVLTDWVDAPVDELEFELEAPWDNADTPAPEVEAAPEEAPQVEEAAPEALAVFGAPLSTRTIKLSKNATKTVYMGLSYVVAPEKGKLSGCMSSDTTVAKISKAGAITLRKPGTAKLTVKTGSKKKLILTLNVMEAPAPQKPAILQKNGQFTLKWSKAKFATNYLAQYSRDNAVWVDLAVTGAGLSLDVTGAVDGPTWFRVRAVLGDAFGGTSDTVSVLAPPSDVKVVCEENRYTGPTDRLNVTWSAVPGATGYRVYRATLPDGEFVPVATLRKTLYADTRDPIKLYAYRVQPLCDGLELPMSEPVTLWSGLVSNVLPPRSLGSDTGIILLVNKKAQVVTAYIRDANGRYTLPLRHMICSTGRTYDRTRNGTYKLQGKKREWYTYSGPSGDTIRWPSVYRSGYYFHSPLYNKDHTLRTHTVSRLGSRASAGCVRLKVTDAEWVYKNCPAGTTVYICDGRKLEKLNKALKPRDVKVTGF